MRVLLLPLVLLLVGLWLLWNGKVSRWVGVAVLIVALIGFAWAALEVERLRTLLGWPS